MHTSSDGFTWSEAPNSLPGTLWAFTAVVTPDGLVLLTTGGHSGSAVVDTQYSYPGLSPRISPPPLKI